jgi:SIR2-like domain
MSLTFDPLREAEELREQLGSDKRRLILFFGAGTSQAVGIDSVLSLTTNVRPELNAAQKAHFDRILAARAGSHIEHVLNHVRLCRELIDSGATKSAGGFDGDDARDMDRAICRAIYKRVKVDPPGGFGIHANVAAWMNSIQRAKPVEIFSTNYDLLIERGLEIAGVPYFDGFVGAVKPYFSDAASELDDEAISRIPKSWVRLWKLHGSIGWRYVVEDFTGIKKVVALPLVEPSATEDLMIFPSREKYSDSRRLPFVALHDRLRRLTASGESLLLVAGYSFGDEHINDILFGNLRANNRLAMTVFLFDSIKNPQVQTNLINPTRGIRNLTIYAPDGASLGGVLGTWSDPPKPPSGVDKWPFWDDAKKQFSLGSFTNVPTFLQEFIGARSIKPAASTTGTLT